MVAVETAGERMLHRRLLLVDAANVTLLASLRHVYVYRLFHHHGMPAVEPSADGLFAEDLANLVIFTARLQLAW